MTKTLTIDNGNTNPHIGLFEEESLVKVLPLEEIETIKSFLAKEHQKEEAIQAIISNVGDKEKLQQKLSLLSPKFQLRFITEIKEERSFLNMPVSYSMTLGDDRLCQAYFAWVTNRKDSVVVIDSGTFTTVDFVSPKGLLGGYIFPGPQTYLNSFQRGSDLPILELPEAPKRDILEKTPINFPDHTRRAIQESLSLIHI